MKINSKSLQKLDEDFFLQFKNTKYYKKEQIIIEPGVEPAGVFYLKAGYVRLFLISKDGKELTFNIYKPGMFFPMIWAITDSPNIYFLECLTDVEVLKAPKEKVAEFLKENPEVLFDLTKRILSGLEGMTKLMDVLLSKNAYNQVCAVILMLARRFSSNLMDHQLTIDVPLTHRLIGTLAGLSREATSRELEKLEKEKIIDQSDHKIVVKDVKKLEEEFTTYASENIIF
jgi:CRP/FNR family transcriptional regulator, cyclic AMP receptor protein